MNVKSSTIKTFLQDLLPPAIESPVAAELGLVAALEKASADSSQIRFIRVGGGQINDVYRIEFPGGASLLMKWHPDPPPGFFAAEAEGLTAIANAKSLRVPAVLAVSERGLLLEWLEHGAGLSRRAGRIDGPNGTGEASDPGKALGQGLAGLHRVSADAFGFPKDNYIGVLPQPNGWIARWSDFYRERRLVPQLDIAAQKGRLNPRRRRLAERLLKRLTEWIDDEAVRPSLLHGDLWGGNWLVTPTGPAVIDPAVYYGDREMDLAMASLFGGFPQSFYDAYQEAWPLPPGHQQRRPLYQLYYLLIHLNIFGESYGPSVDRILSRYGG